MIKGKHLLTRADAFFYAKYEGDIEQSIRVYSLTKR